jgi:predicted GNAT family acetyltransferase
VTIRGLAARDAQAFGEFLATLPREEREFSGLEFGPQPTWGAFADNRLVGAAGFDAWPEKIAHLNVGVRPSFRHKGIGTALVRATSRGALARRRIVQFRTAAASTAAVKIAQSLGLELFAETIYIRPLNSP